MNLVLDSSVFVEALVRSTHQSLCQELLGGVYRSKKVQLFSPSILPLEVVNAVSKNPDETLNQEKRIGRLEKAVKTCHLFVERPGANVIDINNQYWQEWVGHLRGKHRLTHTTVDEIFLFTAFKTKSSLITLDQRMLLRPECLAGTVTVLSPFDGLKLLQS